MSSLCDQFHFKFPGFFPQSKVKHTVDSNRGFCASSVVLWQSVRLLSTFSWTGMSTSTTLAGNTIKKMGGWFVICCCQEKCITPFSTCTNESLTLKQLWPCDCQSHKSIMWELSHDITLAAAELLPVKASHIESFALKWMCQVVLYLQLAT